MTLTTVSTGVLLVIISVTTMANGDAQRDRKSLKLFHSEMERTDRCMLQYDVCRYIQDSIIAINLCVEIDSR